MIKWSGIALIAIGILHMIVLGHDALPEAPGWLRLELWTWEHWQPFHMQPPGLAASGGAFWSTIGSFAIPQIVLGFLIVWLDRKNYPVPAFVGWSLALWAATASLIVEPSGFPIGIPIAVCLLLGIRRRNEKMAKPSIVSRVLS